MKTGSVYKCCICQQHSRTVTRLTCVDRSSYRVWISGPLPGILTGSFRSFLRSLQVNGTIVTWNRSPPLRYPFIVCILSPLWLRPNYIQSQHSDVIWRLCTPGFGVPEIMWQFIVIPSASLASAATCARFVEYTCVSVAYCRAKTFSPSGTKILHTICAHPDVYLFHAFFAPCTKPNFMEQNHSWEADSCAVSEEIPRLLWNSKVHCRVHRSSHWPLSSHHNSIGRK
jgi:hypothetical protein